ncbi:MAG: malectin domain-containing carbohydrate-binding protein [Terracidiphilus sp.]|jgi:glucuronoarabinoxylan endo-1,4-beta-xylanase
MKLRVLCSVAIAASAFAASASAQTADSINFGTTYQTIRGYGVATAWQPLMSSTVVDSLWGMGSGQMGLTMVRQRIDPSSTTGGSNWSTELQNSLEVLAVAPNTTVFATPWTPPAVWKSNDSTVEGTLTTANYANYANYLNAYIAYMKAGGVNLYAISMQNEPDANVTYESCVWTGATMEAWVAQEGGTINTKLIMPESESFIESMSDPTLANSTAASHVSIIGGHLYGATPYYYTNAKNAGKDVWMTEHYIQSSGATPAIGDAINVAKEIHNSMAVGQYNAYVWWWANADIQQGLLNSSNTPGYNGFALAQFSKFVRPGYVMTGANNSPVSGVYVTSYKGSSNYVIVAINSNSSASSIDFELSGATLTSMTPYQTNSSGGLIQEGAVGVSSNSFTYTLPAQSITTFVGTGTGSSGGPIDIDSGGAASGSWVADADFSGGTALTFTNAVSTSLLSGTIPPQTVLQSQRYGSGSSFTYTIPGYTSGSSHTVTLYFVENYVTGTGQREFNVLINGTQVLTNYDVYAAAGSQFNAVEKSFTTTANSSGQIVIEFSPGAIQNPMVSGIAIQ